MSALDMGLTDTYLQALIEESQVLEDQLASGKCKDFEDYKYRVGIIKGLAMAERILRDEINKITQLQNED